MIFTCQEFTNTLNPQDPRTSSNTVLSKSAQNDQIASPESLEHIAYITRQLKYLPEILEESLLLVENQKKKHHPMGFASFREKE